MNISFILVMTTYYVKAHDLMERRGLDGSVECECQICLYTWKESCDKILERGIEKCPLCGSPCERWKTIQGENNTAHSCNASKDKD